MEGFIIEKLTYFENSENLESYVNGTFTFDSDEPNTSNFVDPLFTFYDDYELDRFYCFKNFYRQTNAFKIEEDDPKFKLLNLGERTESKQDRLKFLFNDGILFPHKISFDPKDPTKTITVDETNLEEVLKLWKDLFDETFEKCLVHLAHRKGHDNITDFLLLHFHFDERKTLCSEGKHYLDYFYNHKNAFPTDLCFSKIKEAYQKASELQKKNKRLWCELFDYTKKNLIELLQKLDEKHTKEIYEYNKSQLIRLIFKLKQQETVKKEWIQSCYFDY